MSENTDSVLPTRDEARAMINKYLAEYKRATRGEIVESVFPELLATHLHWADAQKKAAASIQNLVGQLFLAIDTLQAGGEVPARQPAIVKSFPVQIPNVHNAAGDKVEGKLWSFSQNCFLKPQLNSAGAVTFFLMPGVYGIVEKNIVKGQHKCRVYVIRVNKTGVGPETEWEKTLPVAVVREACTCVTAKRS